MDSIETVCEVCHGTRYSEEVLKYQYKGKNIAEVMDMTVRQAIQFFEDADFVKKLDTLVQVGLGYLHLNQSMTTLSGGELQRVKLASKLDERGQIFILDEPTDGLHLDDIRRLMKLFNRMTDQGNTLFIIEHSLDVMKDADYIVELGPGGGLAGGSLLFAGTPKEMLEAERSVTREYLRESFDIWVRKMPKGCLTKETFPFYTPEMWDYEFQMHFAKWLHEKKDGVRACFLIGIRTQESFNRWRSIHLNRKYQMYHNYRWTSKIGNDIFNAYPIYDWKTTDIWTANGKFGFDYNHLYDLYYKAGVNIERQRVASPFLCEAQESLKLYRVIDPNTWGRMIGRVNGVNFTGIYGGTRAMGWQTVRLPEGYTWKGFMQFLLSTLPEETRRNYLKKLTVSIEFWRTKGGCLADETIQKLRDAGVSIEVINTTNYKTNKKPVRMDYLDDIDIAEFREIPTYKRMCICILKNDHACKYMGFALNKEEAYKRDKIMEQFKI